MRNFLDNLIRKVREIRPMVRLQFWIHGFKYYPYAGGEGDPPADPPPSDPPADPPADPASESGAAEGGVRRS